MFFYENPIKESKYNEIDEILNVGEGDPRVGEGRGPTRRGGGSPRLENFRREIL